MRIVTNQKLVNRNRKWAQYLFFLSFALLIGGLLITNQQGAPQSTGDVLLTVVAPALVLPIAFVATLASVRMTNLWARLPRPEDALRDGLKGINPKAVLYNYYHFPSRHVLFSPQGVFAIVTRFQDGNYTCVGDQWSSNQGIGRRLLGVFRFDGIGNPTADALKAKEHVQSMLKSSEIDVEVQPLIVFVSPRVQLQLENPVVPVVHTVIKHELSIKKYLQEVGKDKKLVFTPEQLQRFESLTGIQSTQ
jgi:hypothetical protein